MKNQQVFVPIDRKSSVPLYRQIAEGIRRILDASPRADLLLPPQRDLAGQLGVSRNTVSMAYAELEREGRVTSRVGRGTAVVGPEERTDAPSRLQRIRAAVEHSVEVALTLGFTLDEYADAVHRYLREKREMLTRIRLVFIECNREQLAFYSESLSVDTGVEIIPVLLTDIREKPAEFLPKLRDADIVLTSFYHVDEVGEFLGEEGPPLVGISSQPAMSTIVEIARIPSDASVGCISFSSAFMDEMGGVLARMQIDPSRTRRFNGRDEAALRDFIRSVDVVIVSPPRLAEVDSILHNSGRCIEFQLVPDRGSINNLRLALLELQEQRDLDAGVDNPLEGAPDGPEESE